MSRPVGSCINNLRDMVLKQATCTNHPAAILYADVSTVMFDAIEARQVAAQLINAAGEIDKLHARA